MQSKPVDFETKWGDTLRKEKVFLLIGTLISEVLVENLLARVEPIVAKNLLNIFAMPLLSLTSLSLSRV